MVIKKFEMEHNRSEDDFKTYIHTKKQPLNFKRQVIKHYTQLQVISAHGKELTVLLEKECPSYT